MHDEYDNIIDEDNHKSARTEVKPDKTTRKKLENYLEELELKRQLEDWADEDEPGKKRRK